MVPPKITDADIIAVRDGHESGADLGSVLRADPAAQLALLEARLLALALTLPPASAASPSIGSRSTAEMRTRRLDPETLSAYLRGDLADEPLARLEESVRGNPDRFAELIAFKDAFFGRRRPGEVTAEPPAPKLKRREIAVLTLHTVGSRVRLRWEGTGVRFQRSGVALLQQKDFARPSFKVSPPDLFDTGRVDEMEYFQRRLADLLRDIQTTMLFLSKSNDPSNLDRLRRQMDELNSLSQLQQEQLLAIQRTVDLTVRALAAIDPKADDDFDADFPRAVLVAGYSLRFLAPEGPESLRLEVDPAHAFDEEPLLNPQFTWVRPGLDFRALPERMPLRERLPGLREEALLLIDGDPIGGEYPPTRVIRVRRG